MPDLTLVCDVCHDPIAQNDGILWADMDAVHRREQQYRAWKDEHPPEAGYSLGDLDDMPDRVRWQAVHFRCGGQEEYGPYALDVNQVDTWPRLVETAAHLMEKNWLNSTDWDVVLRETAQGSTRRLVK